MATATEGATTAEERAREELLTVTFIKGINARLVRRGGVPLELEDMEAIYKEVRAAEERGAEGMRERAAQAAEGCQTSYLSLTVDELLSRGDGVRDAAAAIRALPLAGQE